MADYQLLGDGFGYHPGYAPTGNPSNSNPGGPSLEQQGAGPNNAAMAAMMSSSAIGGSPGYGMMPPHGPRGHGLPQRSLPPFGAPLPMPPGSVPLGSLGDASKMHDQYASSGFPASQSAMRGSHYSPHDSRYGHSGGYPGVPMSSGPAGPSSLGGMSQHNGGLVPQPNLTPLPGSSSYQTRGMLSGYSDQRMLSPILGPGSGSPYPGSYPSSYGPTPPSGPSTRLWPNQGMSHVQQRSPYGYNTGSAVPPQASSSRSGQPPSSPFGPSAGDYGSLHSQQPTKQSHQPPSQSPQQQQQQSQAQSTRPYYGTSSSRGAPPSSSLASFIPSEQPPTMSPYLPSSYNSQNISGSQGSSTSRLPDTSGSSNGSRQPHYTSLGYSTPSSATSGMLSLGSNSGAPINYPGQQYPGYNVNQGYSDNSNRLSPYTMSSSSTAGQSAGPNSPGYRPPFSTSSLSSMSPRRPTPTPPAGSPMPPTSRTPDRSSTTISTSGPTSNYPNSGQLTSPSASGLSPGNSSKSSGLAPLPSGSSSTHPSSSSHNASSSSSQSSQSSSHGPLSSHQSTPINSLQQLEQMVMPHLNSSSTTAAAASSNKINSISSIISSSSSSSNNSSSSNPYYSTMSGSSSNNIHASQQSQPAQKSDQQQPSNLYPRFPSPSSASSSGGNYYGNTSGYPQTNSSSWRPPSSSQSSSGPGSNSMSNTQSPMASAVPFSPASQLDQQSSRSKEAPSPGLSRSLSSTGQTVGLNSMASTSSNNNSSSISGQQYSMFDNQTYSSSSPSIDNSNYQSQSSSKQDLVNKSVMSPRTPGSNQQSQQPMSPFNFRNIDANKTSSFGSPQVTKEDSGSESKSDSGKQQNDASNSNMYSVLTSPAGGDNRNERTNTPANAESTSRSSQDNMNSSSASGPPSQSMDSGYHQNYMLGTPNEPGYIMSQQQQQQSSDGSMYPNQQPPNQPPSNWGNYNSGYGQSYDMNMAGDSGMNPSYMGPDSIMYNQSYNQSSGMMSPMMSNQMNQNEYGSNSVNNDMNPSQPYDPYGDTFDQEPPIAKKKGKGRPRKDPSEPKKEKKPRAPRAPKGTGSRGRGRGARSSPESRMGASPSVMSGPMTPSYDGSYSMGSNEMYPYPPGQIPMDSMGGGGPMSYPPPPPPHSLPPSHPPQQSQSHAPHSMNQSIYGQIENQCQLPPHDFQTRPDLSNEMIYQQPHDPNRIPGNDQSAYKPMPSESSLPYESQQHVRDQSDQPNQQQSLSEASDSIHSQSQQQPSQEQEQPQRQDDSPETNIDQSQHHQLEYTSENQSESNFSKSVQDENINQSSSSETIASTTSNDGQPSEANEPVNTFRDSSLTNPQNEIFYGITNDDNSLTQPANINPPEQQDQQSEQINEQQLSTVIPPLPPLPAQPPQPAQAAQLPARQPSPVKPSQQQSQQVDFLSNEVVSSMGQNFPNQTSTPPPPVEVPQLLPPPPELPAPLSENTCDDSVVISKMEFNEEQTPSSTPVKRKAKKRKAKDMKDSVPFDEGPFMSEGGHQTFFSEDGQETKKKKRKRKKTDANEIKTDDTAVEGGGEMADETGLADESGKGKKKKRKKPKKKVTEEDENKPVEPIAEGGDTTLPSDITGDIEGGENREDTIDGDTTLKTDDGINKSKGSGKKKRPSRVKPKLKDDSGKSKKRLPKLALKFGKSKKRKRFGSSDASDIEKTPPPSPEDPAAESLKRRSARNTKRQKYTDDIDLDLSEEDSNSMEKGEGEKKIIGDGNVLVTKINEDTMVIEKIMASRMGEREIEFEEGEENNGEVQKIQVEEYYVKYKNLSYLHCEWRTEEELEMGDKRVNQKIKRWKQKKESDIDFNFLDDEPFNPDYTEVDRILDVQEIEETIEEEVEVDEDEEDEREDTKVEIVPVLLNENGDSEVKSEENNGAVKDKSETSTDTEVTIAPVPVMPQTDDLLTKSEEDVKSGENSDRNPDDIVETEDEKMSSLVPELKIESSTHSEVINQEDNYGTVLKPVDKKAETDDSDKMKVSDDTENCSQIESDQIFDENCGRKVTDIQESVQTSTDENEPKQSEHEIESDKAKQADETKEEENKENSDKNDKNEEIDQSEPVPGKRKKKILRKRIVRHYLVKWRALPYEESTWELEDDLDPLKIVHFWKFKSPPPKDKWKPKKRPKANEWKRLEASPLYKVGNTLREYQLEGVNWLMFCWHNGRNCILADEMGLGKTIQSISFIQEMFKFGITGPFLVIAPLSTIGNWQREFETWTDLNVITYHGSSASRNMLQEYEMYYKKDNGERYEGFYKFQVMITTFEIVLTDCLELYKITWRACIIDEAHRLKNRNCKLLEGLRQLTMEHRVLLTGTPLQNNVEELFSLLNFLEPVQFASSDLFMAEFGDLKTEDQVDKLKALLKPMMLRRLKEDVEKSLAPKEETIIEVELTNVQKKYYRAILERNFQFLTKGNSKQNIPNLMNTMMELRKCCIHPYLINGAEESIIQEYRQSKPESSNLLLDALVHASGKLVLIDKLLPRLKADGHRVLIFSQMVRCLDILEDYLCQNKYPFERIDGRVRGNMRQAAIDRFSKPGSDRFVFLLCTRAGGLGINLTAADTVIIFDSDWNPQNDLQAQARCHRIGQSKMVKVYRLICRNTYEREMFDKASLKLGLDRAVLQSMNSNNAMNENGLSKKDVEDLLRKGAYGAIMDDDNAGDKFCEEDIEQILQRRTQIITLESEEKGSTFSKASFAASDNRSDIEIDDPNFWEKWAKKAQLDVDELTGKNDLIVQEPRRRTQTKRFGQDEQMLEISDADSSDEDDENVSTRTRGGRSKFKLKKGKRGREREDEFMEDFAPGNWTKAECYQVEKGLLCYGWGRWDKYLETGIFKRHITLKDVEHVARVIMLQCLQNVRGDDKRKETSFYWEIISPNDFKNEDSKSGNNSTSLEEENIEPSPGSATKRRSKKSKHSPQLAQQPVDHPVINQPIDPNDAPLVSYEWAKEDFFNPDLLLPEDYRSHVAKISNKILLRFKLLWYLKTEIFGDLCDLISKGISCKEAPFSPPSRDGYPGLPPWWDEDADKSLLMGVYKHGYDRYNRMRLDPALCFLSRCGPPDGTALMAELTSDDINKEEDDETETPEATSTSATNTNTSTSESVSNDESKMKENPATGEEAMPFPSSSDLNKRFRNLISAYQRNVKKQVRLERTEAVLRERRKEAAQKKWSKKDDSDFYRTIISFGVDFNKETGQYDWSRFRMLSKLDKKSDESLTEYFKSFFVMCKKVIGRPLTEEEENYTYLVDPISEDRATRALARIELLCKIREEILPHPDLDERLNLCQMSIDLPDWWICGRHDKDLLVGAAKYGLSRLDINLMNDPELSFMKIFRNDETEARVKVECKQSGENVKRETTLEINKIDPKPKTKEPKREKKDSESETTENEKVPESDDVTEKPVEESSEEKSTNDGPETKDSEIVEKKADEAQDLEIKDVNETVKDELMDVDKGVEKDSKEKPCSEEKVDDSEAKATKEGEEVEISSTEKTEKEENEELKSNKEIAFEPEKRMCVDEETNETVSEKVADETEGKTVEVHIQETENEEKDSSEVNKSSEKMDQTKNEDQKKEGPAVDVEMAAHEKDENDSKDGKLDEGKEEQKKDDDEMDRESEREADKGKQVEAANKDVEKEAEEKEEDGKQVSVPEEKEGEPEKMEVETKTVEEKSEEVNDQMEDEKAEEQKEVNDKVEDNMNDKENEKTEAKETSIDESLPKSETKQEESKRKSERVTRNTQMEITIIKKESTIVDSKLTLANSGSVLDNELTLFPQSTDNFASRGFIRWPKERVLIVRLEQICHCVEKNEWPFAKQALFTALGTVPSTPSIATADSSPRAASPVSISSISREATPQQTPDNTPRHESVSPSPDPFMFDVANASGMLDVGGRLRSRGRRRRRYEMEHPERAKLRNLLQQSDIVTQPSNKKNMNPNISSMMANNPPLLPPLFSMSLQNFRNELANDDKGSSLLMNRSHVSEHRSKSHSHHPSPNVVHPFASSSMKTPLAPPISDLPNKSGSTKSQGPPPAAHSSSNSKRIPNLDTIDLRFAKPVPGQQPMTPASKPLPPPDKVVKRSSTPVSPSSILDLSGPVKTDSRFNEDVAGFGSLTSPTLGKKGQPGKRFGRRIDDLATNLLRQKKMMQEKQDDPPSVEKPKSSPSAPSPRELRARSELEKVETRTSGNTKDRSRTPPAAHSSSRSASLSASLTRDLPMKPPEKTNFISPKVNSRSGHKESSSSSSRHPQSVSADIASNLKANTPKASFNEQAALLKKYLEDHPELMSHPTFATAALVLSGASPLSANTQLLELPDNRKRSSRRSKPDIQPPQSHQKVQPPPQPQPSPSPSGYHSSSHQPLPNFHSLTGNEHIPLVNKLNGKKLSGSKAPTLNQLRDFLIKNPTYEIDPKWSNLLRENTSTLKSSSSQHTARDPPPAPIRTRTSDRKVGESSGTKSKHSDSSGSSRRATAASLLANQAAASSTSSSSSTTPATSSSFGFPPSSLNPFNVAPNLSSSYLFHKMLMDQGGYLPPMSTSSATSSSSRNINSIPSSTTTTTSSTSSAVNASQMLFPFGGLAGMNLANPLFNLSALNIPGLGSGFNQLSIPGLGGNEGKKKDHGSSSSSGGQDKGRSNMNEKTGSSSGHKSGKSSSSKNQNQNQNLNLSDPTSLYGSLPFLNLNPSLLYSSLGLGGFPLPSSPFASLAQSGLMNGLGNLTGSGTTSTTSTTSTPAASSYLNKATSSSSSSSHSKNKNSSSTNNTPHNINQLSVSSKRSKSTPSPAVSMKSPPPASQPQQSPNNNSTPNIITGPTMASSLSGVTGLGDSDDESLKSLMGQEDDLNGDQEDLNETADTDTEIDSGADGDSVNKKRKQRRSTSSTSSMKSPPVATSSGSKK